MKEHRGMTFDEWEGSYGATSFDEWCQHYGYDPDSEKARTDYGYYLDGVALMVEMFATTERS